MSLDGLGVFRRSFYCKISLAQVISGQFVNPKIVSSRSVFRNGVYSTCTIVYEHEKGW